MASVTDDISDAPTYADALERAKDISITYRTGLSSFVCCGSILLVVLFSIIFSIGQSSPAIELVIVLMIVLIGVLLLIIRNSSEVSLRNGMLLIIKVKIPLWRISLADVRGVGSHYRKRYVFSTRGRKTLLPPPIEPLDKYKEQQIFSLLHQIGTMRATEQAKHLAESKIEIPVPLTEFTTMMRVPILVLGLLLLVPLGAIIALSIYSLSTGDKETILPIIGSLSIVAISGAVIFSRGVIRFVSEYRAGSLLFSAEGIKIKGKLFDYESLKVLLYRGRGEVSDPHPGVLVIQPPEAEPLLIGPDRENFFILPYVLRKWMADPLEVLPMYKAPLEITSLPFRHVVWFHPGISEKALRGDDPDGREEK